MIEADDYISYSTNLESNFSELSPGTYRLIVPRMMWHWVNDDGVMLYQTIPLSMEFTIESD